MWVFYLFAFLLLVQGIIALRGGFSYLAYVRRETERKRATFTPFASIIAPCRGLDQGFRENIQPLFTQNYPAYEIIFVTDRADDPSLAVIENVRQSFAVKKSTVAARICIAGEAKESGQKVHNLCAAVREVDTRSLVLVFVDTDARPSDDWLASLVEPLSDEQHGATTGYRWFIPGKGGLASRLRSVWNASIASALGANEHSNFCWGGSTAIRRVTFDKLKMLERWRGTLSDDFALTHALHNANLPIHFVPDCLTPSLEDCGWRELLEFTTRQIKITRVYAPHLWKIVLFSNLFFVLIFFGGLALVITRAALGLSFTPSLALVIAIYALGALKAHLRWLAVKIPLARHREQLRKGRSAHLLLWPLASCIYLYNALAALFSRRIEWRGITYQLKSAEETVIIPHVNSEETIAAAGKTRRA